VTRTSRVSIGPLVSADGREFVAAARASKRLHGRWVSAPRTAAAFRRMFEHLGAPTDYGFAIRRRDTGVLVGFVALTQVVRGVFLSGYLGYYAFAGGARQGLMKEGLMQIVRHAFRELGLHRLEANIQPGNRASIALVRSCGFSREGYSPRYLKIRGRWQDHERWAILADGKRRTAN
jgi:ribosomal-protein-alanine N-acetyltransferase